MLKIEELKRELDGFCGTQNYYRHFTGLNYTDGVKHLADRAGAYWLVDAVFSWQVELVERHWAVGLFVYFDLASII